MIFPPHCWPSEMTPAEQPRARSPVRRQGLRITSFCYPLLDNNPNSPCRIMRRYTLDRYNEAIDLAADVAAPTSAPSPDRSTA